MRAVTEASACQSYPYTHPRLLGVGNNGSYNISIGLTGTGLIGLGPLGIGE
jgi:hypothetical protein